MVQDTKVNSVKEYNSQIIIVWYAFVNAVGKSESTDRPTREDDQSPLM